MGGERAAGRGGCSTRRQFLVGGAVAGVGAAAAIGIDATLNAVRQPGTGTVESSAGEATVPFHGRHQAGIVTEPTAQVNLISLDLLPGTDRDGIARMMRILSGDAARLTQGTPALADSDPELALAPARLTVTFGFGPGLLARAGRNGPDWLMPLPAFGIDRLRPEFCDGDLLLQIGSDDPNTVAHTARMLLKDARAFATVRWVQRGFRHAHGSFPAGSTMRNLFGQLDGTANPAGDELDTVVWIGEGWLAGGTGIVIRRIEMNLETWDEVDRPGREHSIGRFLDSGAPLTGTGEYDEPDFDAKTAIGFPVIPEFSHMRRARSDNPNERILRRAYNYDDPPEPGEVSSSGQLFMSFQADVNRQFVPIQRRLDELDMLNRWTTPIGSAVFAIPPGCAEGGFIGQTVLG